MVFASCSKYLTLMPVRSDTARKLVRSPSGKQPTSIIKRKA